MKKSLCISIMVLWGMALSGQTFTIDNLNYSINEGNTSVTVTGHVDGTEAEGDIVIPNTVSYNGRNYPVTAIGQYAFKNSHKLHGTLTIGSNVKDIEYGAFAFCDSLSGNLTIPNSVINIGSHAFKDCKGFIGSLTIPNSVVSIGICAFDQCGGFNGTLTIGNSVTIIGNGAFTLCSNINRAVCLAVEPPVLNYAGSNMASVFYGLGCSTITVPCGSKEAYENSWWKTSYGFGGVVHSYGFETILEDCEDVCEVSKVTAGIYPNPAHGMIYVSKQKPSEYQIVNLSGEIIMSGFISSESFPIDISNMPKGTFIIKTGDNSIKFIVE